jgi:hypothetical protein
MAASSNGVRDGQPRAYAARSLIDAPTLQTIADGNCAFLGLVAARARRASEPSALGLAPSAVAGIAALEGAQRALAACASYTLFNLRFEDPLFWHALVTERRNVPPPAADVAEFTRTAVFMAWHLVQSGELTPTLVLGMDGAVQRIWRALPLPALERLACAAAPELRARWAANALYWPALIEAASARDATALEAARVLGRQLLAADALRVRLAAIPS